MSFNRIDYLKRLTDRLSKSIAADIDKEKDNIKHILDQLKDIKLISKFKISISNFDSLYEELLKEKDIKSFNCKYISLLLEIDNFVYEKIVLLENMRQSIFEGIDEKINIIKANKEKELESYAAIKDKLDKESDYNDDELVDDITKFVKSTASIHGYYKNTIRSYEEYKDLVNQNIKLLDLYKLINELVKEKINFKEDNKNGKN